jgi:hypothetical protein
MHSYAIGCFIAVRYPGCHESRIYQAGLHRMLAEVRGAGAYHIAGVYYQQAQPDGAGILVKDGIVVRWLL